MLSRSLGRLPRGALHDAASSDQPAGELGTAELAGAVGEYEAQMRGRGPGRLTAWLLRRLPR